jgi:murein DD-endopeptidase MepM/ murein hydrolase activator NlpD
MHEGLDIGATPGTPIYAPADGIVVYSGTKPGFGNTLSIDHGYGIETIYAHAKALKVVKGVHLHRGDLIAEVGNTGYSTGPHLHYEIRINGIAVDPLYYILD